MNDGTQGSQATYGNALMSIIQIEFVQQNIEDLLSLCTMKHVIMRKTQGREKTFLNLAWANAISE